MYASIYRSILLWASVHVTLSVGYAAVISEWPLDIFRKFLKPLIYLSYKIQLTVIPNLYLSFKKVIHNPSRWLNVEQLLCNQSGVLFQRAYILGSMIQVKLMNIIKFYFVIYNPS